MPSDQERPVSTDAAFGALPGPWSPSIRCRTWNEAHQTTSAMQRGGVLLRTPAPPPVGSEVHLMLKLPDATEVVLVGAVMQHLDPPDQDTARRGAIVRFRVAAPIVTQLESRAWKEGNREARPATPLARGSAPGDSPLLSMAPLPPAPAALTAASDAPPDDSGTTYAIHRKPKKP